MTAPVFIGDEISATGYRLSGVRTRTPEPNETLEVLTWACEHAPLVMITAEYAAHLTSADSEHFLSRISPPVVVVPAIRSQASGKALANRLRAQMGVLE